VESSSEAKRFGFGKSGLQQLAGCRVRRVEIGYVGDSDSDSKSDEVRVLAAVANQLMSVMCLKTTKKVLRREMMLT
jgi:hypothetical protein